MRYDLKKREITLSRELNKLDKLVLNFVKILEKHVSYVIVSGYVSILLGRARATEDVDIIIEKISENVFSKLYAELKKRGFWCLNADKPKEIYSYLKDGLAVRFAIKGTAIPNFEIKFPKSPFDNETFQDVIAVLLPKGKLRISSLERQIAFKRYYLKSEKDMEDALHIEELFKAKLDYEKINKLKRTIAKTR